METPSLLFDTDTFLVLNSETDLSPKSLIRNTQQHNQVLCFQKARFQIEKDFILLNERQGHSVTLWLCEVNYSKG